MVLLRKAYRLSLFLLFCVVSASPVLAQSSTTPVSPQGSRISVSPQEYDFGVIVEGQKVDAVFKVKNIGGADLDLQRIVAGCGCIVAELSKSIVTPGESVDVKVAFDSTGYSGTQRKGIRIFSGDRNAPFVTAFLKGEVKPEVSVAPARVVFDQLQPDDQGRRSQEVELTLSQAKSGALEFGSIVSSSPKITAEALSQTGQVLRIRVAVGQVPAIGEYRERIVVGLKGGIRRSVNIPVVLRAEGHLRVRPQVVSFGLIEGEQPLVREVVVTNLESEPSQLTIENLNEPGISAELGEVEPGKKFKVRITVAPSEIGRVLKSNLVLNVEGKQRPKTTIQLFGLRAGQK